MAAITVAKLNGMLGELTEFIESQITDLSDQIAALEGRMDNIEESGDKRKTRGRNMTPEQRQEAGRRLQQARADKLGLETIEQLRELHLAPGKTPTKKEIARVLKDFPADESTFVEFADADEDEEDDE